MTPLRQQQRLGPRILKRPTPSPRPGCKRVSQISTGSAKVAWKQAALLLSEIAQYPLLPAVVKITLGFKDDEDAQLIPGLFTTSQLSTAILDSDDNITPQWYIEPLERHIQRLQHATTVMNDIEPKLKTW